MRLHARAPAGTRIEKTEQIFADIENEIRQVIPPREIDNIIDNIGIPERRLQPGVRRQPDASASAMAIS